MKKILLALILIPLGAMGQEAPPVATDPIKPIPVVSVFPVSPIVQPKDPAPPVPVNPDAVPVLLPGQLFVVKSDVAFKLWVGQDDLVTIRKVKGPRDISGVFFDGKGEDEDRTYDNAFLAIVKANNKGKIGRLKLIYDPKGSDAEDQALVVFIDIVAARPPPIPIPPVPPAPTPIADIVTTALTGPTAKSDAIILVAAAEKVLATMPTYKTAAELQQHWFALLKANNWVIGSRPVITAILETEIPQEPVGTKSPPLTDAERIRIGVVFSSILDGAKAVLK